MINLSINSQSKKGLGADPEVGGILKED